MQELLKRLVGRKIVGVGGPAPDCVEKDGCLWAGGEIVFVLDDGTRVSWLGGPLAVELASPLPSRASF